jgi:hypothetical protein
VTDIPTDHQLEGAIVVARLIDAGGNALEDARDGYRNATTHGVHPVTELGQAEQTLVQAGLLRIVRGRVWATSGLRALVAVTDPGACMTMLRIMLTEATREDQREAVGSAGEEYALSEIRRELEVLGRSDLGAQVSRVSLISDAYGYDIYAPGVGMDVRLLEVKTQTAAENSDLVRFFITRHEWDIGVGLPQQWALVGCALSPDLRELRIVGWCRAQTLEPYLPLDRHGRWTEARVEVPAHRFIPGVPPAV